MKKIFFFLSFLFILTSCGSDDDICLSSDSTPRLKLKFRSAANTSNQLIRIDTLYVDVDYGKTSLTNIITAQPNVDSIFVPMRVDNAVYTDIYFRTRKNGPRSKMRVSYITKPIYVSPACGYKINYENLNAELLESNPVQNVESNHTSLTDESRINFYLRF